MKNCMGNREKSAEIEDSGKILKYTPNENHIESTKLSPFEISCIFHVF